MHTLQRCRALVIMFGAVALSACVDSSTGPPPGFSIDELTESAQAPEGPVPNARFLPSVAAVSARHAFSGKLTLVGAEMQTDPAGLRKRHILRRDIKLFPDVTVSLVADGEVLIPLDRDLILSGTLDEGGSYWDFLVSPGRVWSEPDEEEWSRAAFPFALASSVENETYNGVATFAFNETAASAVRYQIVRQTTGYFLVDRLRAWGQLDASYEPGRFEAAAEVIGWYRREVADRLPVRMWQELEEATGLDLSDFDDGIDEAHRIVSALVYDGTLYVRGCDTDLGPLPFCSEHRFGIWSVTKSTGNGLAMLRLAQKYGPEVFDERIADHLEVTASHDGWEQTTFGQVLNMATGVGEGSTNITPNNPNDGYLVGYDSWYTAMSRDARISEVFKAPDHPWGPGEVMRYRDQDAFVLGAAMDAYLKSREGPEADMWRFLMEEVYAPIGIQHAPTNRLLEADGRLSLPQMSQGSYPTLDDLARIGQLLHNGGRSTGQQILHEGKLAEALYRSPGSHGIEYGEPGPDGSRSYRMSFWHQRYRGEGGCVVDVASMSGWGGHRVELYPNGLVAIRIANEPVDAAGSHSRGMAAVADRLAPFCP